MSTADWLLLAGIIGGGCLVSFVLVDVLDVTGHHARMRRAVAAFRERESRERERRERAARD